MSVVSVVCCAGRYICCRGSPTNCCVLDHAVWILRRPWSTRASRSVRTINKTEITLYKVNPLAIKLFENLQFGLRHNRSTTNNKFCIGQIIEKEM
jgi:hypothetical protein